MKKNTIVIIVVGLLIGLLLGYFIINHLYSGNTLSKNNISLVKNPNNDKTSIEFGNESTSINIRSIKEKILKEKYGKSLSFIKNEAIKSKLSEAFLNAEISEDFLSQSIDYASGDITFLLETKQLFKNISFYVKKISNLGTESLNAPLFDEYDAVRYFIPLIDLKDFNNFGISGSEMISYKEIQNNFLFLKDPFRYKDFSSLRNENKSILDWKNGISIPSSMKDSNPYLYFLLTDITRSTFKNEFLQKIPKTKNDTYLMHAFLARLGVDLQYLDLETLESKDSFIEYIIDDAIDYWLIDRTLLSQKDYCPDILNPRISELCLLYTQNKIGDEKYLRIFKEYLIYKFLYQE